MESVGVAGQTVIGVDLGGTAIKLGRFDRTGKCLQSLSVPTPQPPQPEVVCAAMVKAIAQLDPHGNSLAIGVGTPGPADVSGRIARVAINLGWKDVPLADWLEQKTGKPTLLANDANCAGLGEAWLGAGRSLQNLILLTLGTGVGGAVILDGKLFVGRDGTAGELGLITIDYAGHSCNSGNDGSLEQHVSVQAIRRRTGLEPDVLGAKAKAGDAAAIAFWKTYGCELGAGLASLIYVLTPEAVIIGGGVSASAEFFFPSMEAEIERRVLSTSRAGLQLLTAELGNQAGIVGAAKLAWQIVDGAATPREDSTAMLHQAQLAYAKATEMSRFKAGFLARTSHELRSPLNSVISLHQLILSDLCDSSEEEREFVNQAHTAAQKMLRLLDEVIHISKAEHGTELELQPLPLKTMLEEVQRLTQLQAQNRSLRLEIESPPADVYVTADPRWLNQILLSLIDTPLSMMQEGSVRVTTRVDAANQQVYIQVEDERPAQTWSEPVDWMEVLRSPQPLSLAQVREAIATANTRPFIPKFSPELGLLINQTLLEQMGGQLKVLALPTADGAKVTCVQCSIPLVHLDEGEG